MRQPSWVRCLGYERQDPIRYDLKVEMVGADKHSILNISQPTCQSCVENLEQELGKAG